MIQRFAPPCSHSEHTSIPVASSEARRTSRRILTDAFEHIEVEPISVRRIIGIASSAAIDSHNTVLDPWGCIASVPCPLLFEHATKGRLKGESLESLAIGEVYSCVRTRDTVAICACVYPTRAGDRAWELILSREARALSVAITNERLRGVVDGVRYFDQWRLAEVSIVRAAANSECSLYVLPIVQWEAA